MSSEEEADGTVVEHLAMLPPVEAKADLPAEAEESVMCFVRAEGRSFTFVDGEWKPSNER